MNERQRRTLDRLRAACMEAAVKPVTSDVAETLYDAGVELEHMLDDDALASANRGLAVWNGFPPCQCNAAAGTIEHDESGGET